MEKTHWRKVDFRKSSLIKTIEGLENSISTLKNLNSENEWYDSLFLLEDIEPIIGMAFITCQNYINSSIFDLDENLSRKLELYKKGQFLAPYGRTRIELIIAVSNYFKHRDDDKRMHKGTSIVLESFNFEYEDFDSIEDSPIFKAIELFDKNWRLNSLIDIVNDWRKDIWE